MANRLLELEELLLQPATTRVAPARAKQHVVRGSKATTKRPVTVRRRPAGVRTFSRPVDFRVPGIVPPVRQPSANTCWATVATMMISWRENVSLPIGEAMQRIGRHYADLFGRNRGLPGSEKPTFLAAAGLVGEYPLSMAADGWEAALREYGPLWVTTDEWPGAEQAIHARIIVGIHGDGSEAGTMLDVIDPADGREHAESVTTFREKFEAEVRETKNPPRIQIVHWPRDAKFSVVKSLAVARALSSHAERGLLSEEELAEHEPPESELGPPGARTMRAPTFSLAAAALKPMGAKDAQWADDPRSPDYRHLSANGVSVPFTFSASVLERLCRLNSFVIPKDHTRVVFGLRGCQLASPVSGFARSVSLTEDIPNHIDNRCVIGVWNRTDGTVSVFSASTVPNWKYMENYRQTGAGTNLLPTGMYSFRVGTHRPTRKVKKNGSTVTEPNPGRVQGALLQNESRVVLRSKDDLTYTVFDTWDGGWVGDNIHAGLRTIKPDPSSDPDFASAGCNTIPGHSSKDTPSGDWAAFRAALGFDNANPTANDKTNVMYVLLTGREARLAAEGASDASLTRLRFGSSGAGVSTLQLALKTIKGNEKLKVSGTMDEPTVRAYVRWQQARDHGAADGIVTPDAALALGLDLIAGASVPVGR